MTSKSKESLNYILQKYLEDSKKINNDTEFEIRFGTRGRHKITKIKFDNVIKMLKSNNFKCYNISGEHLLRIVNEFTDGKSGNTKMSNIRCELSGVDNIKNYCSSNDIEDSNISGFSFLQKSYTKNKDGSMLYPVNNDDFEFRIAYQNEKTIKNDSGVVKNILSTWKETKKIFRLLNRITFVHEDYPLKVDLSIVKSSKSDGRPIPEYNIENSEVFTNPESFEVEIEIDRYKMATNTQLFGNLETLSKMIKKCTTIILSGLQDTFYPISYPRQNDVVNKYMRLIHGKIPDYIKSSNFIGYSSTTIQSINIYEKIQDGIPNIRKDYTVTEKADGDRKLLYIDDNGDVYYIDVNMNIQFSGSNVTSKYKNTILDGEHILHDKYGNFINLYAAFDIYYLKGSDVRKLNFVPSGDMSKNKFRLSLLSELTKEIQNSIKTFKIKCKDFFVVDETQSIFQGCKHILSQMENSIYEYEIDGLIFTPANTPVHGRINGDENKTINYKATWQESFKWKPSKYNTIDFLISTVKDSTGNDLVNNKFIDGSDTASDLAINQYKTIILRCGFDEKKHGYINPFQDLINDVKHDVITDYNKNNYKPVPFYPTNPYDIETHKCNIMLKLDSNGSYQMMTEDGVVFQDNTIVEFKYVMENEKGWRWIPIRVRHDKTSEFLNGGKNYGNSYHVANNNWQSIHNPVTEEMITTGENINEVDNDIYYNRSSNRKNLCKSMRDFHNLFVKAFLINSISKKNNTLIDYAVGKGGDIPKWISSQLSFVFGVDISKDNIENKLDGACARYLNFKRKQLKVPDALFVYGDSKMNIRNLDAFTNQKCKDIANAVFGKGPKDIKQNGAAVYKNYGVGKDGFRISSCQFAMHYFFENSATLQGFLKNVSECTEVGGYFIGTCYDGKEIFNLLRNKERGEMINIYEKDEKIWEIVKDYDHKVFEDNINSIGYPVNVFQESIGKSFREYLVNFDYLTKIIENYGFVQLNQDELKKIGLKKGIGNFSELFKVMQDNIKYKKNKSEDYGIASELKEYEKKISFLNKYFIFKKMTNVDTNKVILSNVTEKVEESEEQVEFTGPEIVLKPSIKKKSDVENIQEDDPGLTLVVKEPKKKRKKKSDLDKVLEEEEKPKEEKPKEEKPKKVKKKKKILVIDDVGDSDSD